MDNDTAFKNQHWIPTSYVRGWADRSLPANLGRRVHLYDRDGFYLGFKYPKGVFAEEDLYTIRRADGARDVSVERALGQIEKKFNDASRRLAARKPIMSSDKAICAAFVAALRNRSPQMNEHHRGFLNSVVKLGDELAESMREATPEQRKAMARSSLLGAGDAPSIPLEEFRQLANSPFGARLPGHIAVEAPLLARLNLAVLHTHRDFGFITSDNPVVWWVRASDGRCVGGHFGLGHKAIEVTLPIGPNVCLLFTALDLAGHIEVRDEVVADLNSRVLACCRERFIADRDSLEVDWTAVRGS